MLGSVTLLVSMYTLKVVMGVLWFFLKIIPGKSQKGVLFLENFPVENAGYQYRAAKWASLFSLEGTPAEVWTTCPDKAVFETKYTSTGRHLFMARVMWKRFSQCVKARRFKTVVVRRELLLFNDYGNLFMERFLLSIHPHVILDFDDDIGAAKREPRPVVSAYAKLMQENGSKFYTSLTLYRYFTVGSQYLKELVKTHNTQVTDAHILVVPTCVDYDQYAPKTYTPNKSPITFGWIGGVGNLYLLPEIIAPLNALSQQYSIELLVISGQPFSSESAQFTIRNKPWRLHTEVEDLKEIDIGLMPLQGTKEDLGKGGFKLIQYMGLGMVAVASNYTINSEIVQGAENGFLVTKNQWLPVLQQVMAQTENFPQIGKNARERIRQQYSFNGNKENYLHFIQNLTCAE